MMSTLEQWLERCQVAVRADSTALEAIAANCFAAERAGKNASVWHQTALHFNRPCRCHECTKVTP